MRLQYSEYNNPNNWIGGFYELSIEFYPVGDNERLNQALIGLQSFKSFKGMWKERQDFQGDSISLPINIDDDSVIKFYGALIMNDGNTLPCLISITRIDGGSDWLDISIPQASFEKFYPYEYPLTKELNPWLVKVDEIFISLAETIFHHSPFELAMIGDEISGSTNQGQISFDDVGKIICILPTHLQKRLGVKEKGKELTNQLKLFS